MTMGLHSRLGDILTTTRRRIDQLPPIDTLRDAAQTMASARPFEASLSAPGLSVIAEVKRRSPSRGDLALGLDPVETAAQYADGGAAAISVLTEPDHFSGTNSDLVSVLGAVQIPVLRKDFILDPAQVWESRMIGADALLLIVAALEIPVLYQLIELSAEAGIAVVVEVHNETEIEIALRVGARIIGVNNRDLRTFDVDLATAERLAPLLAGVQVKIAESGISTRTDAKRMREAGYDAILVGESLVTADNPTTRISELIR